MKPQLSENLERYFAAQNAHDAEAMTACFASDARVRDEGHDYVGRDAIREWKRATIAKYGISIEPLEITQKDGGIVITARVSGNFPGSPANLTYSFALAPDGLIRMLEIQ